MTATNTSSLVKREVFLVQGTGLERAAQNCSSKGIEPNDKHLCTDHLLSDLKGRTISGAFITIGAQGAQVVLGFASIMILARLLPPKDFGLFAMVTTVIGYLRVFKDAGLPRRRFSGKASRTRRSPISFG